MQKFISIDQLSKIILKHKAKRKKIVLCHGVFDLLHVGHIKHFKIAKTFGDILVVSITSDQYVNKGPNRPHFKENNRGEAVASLTDVDYVVLNRDNTAVPIITKLRPNFYCKGVEYKNKKKDITKKIFDEEYAVKKNGGKLVFTNEETFSSSNVINKFDESISSRQKKTILNIKKKYSFEKILSLFEKIKNLKILVLGETIIDQYSFCDPLNKSGKDPMLVIKHNKTEEYLGGAVAIAKHLEKLCNNITLLTMLGEKNEYKQTIINSLKKETKLEIINKKNSETIMKKRYIDEISNNKLLGVYRINDEDLDNSDEKKLQKKLIKLIPKHDLVVVSDYSHGFISKKSAKLISKLSKYLALNAQVNSSNVGYHTIQNYFKPDCLIINEKEIRHEFRDRNSKAEDLMEKLSKSQGAKNIIVTQGIEGSILYNKDKKKFHYCEALSKSAIDKIGAGDTMLSLISLCLKIKFDPDISLLISSLAAAQSVKIMGNKKSIDKNYLFKSLEHILK